MLKFLRTSYLPQHLNIVLLITRIAVGSFMLTHGIPKLMKFFSTGDITFSDPLGVGTIPSLMMAIFAEVFCSILVILGLGTRIAVIPLIITMLVAVLLVHANDPFGKKELGLMYLTIYMFLIVVGSGKYSLDEWLLRRQRRDDAEILEKTS
ncbi:MAG: DoxX family protein [Ignavibacteria bacterium]|jgi:putative oxidoreductase|nr:DoxX family protein [Ignavibacteria bacterium]